MANTERLALILLVTMVVLVQAGSTGSSLDLIRVSRFRKQPVCDGDQACLEEAVPAQSLLECLAMCSQNSSCESAQFFQSNNSCVQISVSIVTNTSCTASTASHFRYQRTTNNNVAMTTEAVPRTSTTQPVPLTFEAVSLSPCQNGGLFKPSTASCDCSATGGYIGSSCETLASTCVELFSDNYAKGEYPLTVDLFGDRSVLFKTHCVITQWTTSINFMRSSGSFDMGRSWNDYVNGFWLGENDYWIGLENMHRYTSYGGNHRARITVHFNSSEIVGEIGESNREFVVRQAGDGYAYSCNAIVLSLSNVKKSGVPMSVSLHNVLYSSANRHFSTADTDNDGSGLRNCAQLAGAGWWFDNCDPFTSNPLGLSFTTLPGGASDKHILLPGLDLSDPELAEAFRYVSLSCCQ